jgi:hypothetical protein
MGGRVVGLREKAKDNLKIGQFDNLPAGRFENVII